MSNRFVGGAVAFAALLFAVLLLWGPVSQELAERPTAVEPDAQADAKPVALAPKSTTPDVATPPTNDEGPVEVVIATPETSPVDADTNEETASSENAAEPTTDAPTTASGEVATDPQDVAPILSAPKPEFDVLRVDASGFALAAGRAAANTDVRIYVGDTLATTARAGADGAFVAYFQTPPAAGAQPVRAETDSGASDGPASTEPLFILSSTQPDEAPIIIEPAPEGVVVVQQAQRITNDSVSLDQITYDEQGRVSFAGRGEGVIVLYLDNAKIAAADVADDGSWQTQATNVIAPGIYTLRVDQVANDGAVTSRLETPFQREDIKRGDVGENAMTVQAGNNLWRLAELHYGSGARYTVIFEANRDTIRNPDLIYPGQIFVIPDEKRTDIGADQSD